MASISTQELPLPKRTLRVPEKEHLSPSWAQSVHFPTGSLSTGFVIVDWLPGFLVVDEAFAFSASRLFWISAIFASLRAFLAFAALSCVVSSVLLTPEASSLFWSSAFFADWRLPGTEAHNFFTKEEVASLLYIS